MRVERVLSASFAAVFLLSACSGETSQPQQPGPSGVIELAIDSAALSPTGPIITAATATLSRQGFDPITKELAVLNGVATGQVDGLAPGYWRVEVQAYDGQALIYLGSADVNVLAGVTVQCVILFDPVIIPVTTGSVVVTVGLNPMPGYSAINQAVTNVLFHRDTRKLYVYDAAAQLLGVYDADTLVRTRDVAVPGAPISTALTTDGTGMYLGYASGHVRLLNVSTGEVTLVADVLMEVMHITPLGPGLLLVGGPGRYDAQLKVVNVATGQIVSTRSLWYSLGELVYNPAAKTVYAHHQGVSPTDIEYIKLDDAGVMIANGDSIYHGDYAFGEPIRIIAKGARLVTASGNMFSSAELTTADLRYSGNIGQWYVDLVADETLGKLFVLNASGIHKLLVIDQATYFTDATVDLSGSPARVFETPSSVVVFSVKDGRTYAKRFAKADLGLGSAP